ncbi:MAG: relaxase/mobilization nuclease domain-containing protein, partial [Nakamurella sp.]
MIPNITRGQSMSGLLVYLAGPGRHNEHTEQHLVAGDSAIMAWHGDVELDRATALSVARTIDQPRRAFKVDVPRGNVWHCSLSIKADDGQLSDEQWAAIADDFMDELGFTEASGKSPARWVAVRHGLSQAGNDHIHIAASWVREDGTKMFIRNDYAKSQQTATMLERKYNLQVLESRALGQGTRGYSQADAQISERAGRPEPRRVELARKVRAVAAGSESEAEFVRRARQVGLLVRPRFAAGRQDVVAGYSVALKPVTPERPAWFGGGQLSRDLALPKLRTQWPDTPTGASAAVAEWQAAWRAKRVAAPGREAQQLDPRMWEQRAAEVGALRDRLR